MEIVSENGMVDNQHEKSLENTIENIIASNYELVLDKIMKNHFETVAEKCMEQMMKTKKSLLVHRLVAGFGDDPQLLLRIIHEIINQTPQLFEEILERDSGLAKSIWTYVGETDTILLGSVGKAEYDVINRTLMISGYYLPREVFDTVEVYYQKRLLGIAQSNVKRPDVYMRVPNYHNLYSGWELVVEDVEEIDEGNQVEILVKLKDKIIKSDTKEINFVSNMKESQNRNYKIDISSFIDVKPDVYERIRRFNEVCKQLKMWFDWEKKEYYQSYLRVKNDILHGTQRVEELLLKIFCEKDNNVIHFKDAQIEFQDIGRLWTIINELLIEEEYYFETEKQAPFIIDGGANIGLAIYYFKSKYPNSNILAFEPSREAFSILKKNVEKNKWKDVEILPYALDETEGVQSLYIPVNDCLGASLTKRPYEYNNEEQVKVEVIKTKVLNDFVNGEVDFLKLDVEGVETRVIKHLGDKLNQVEHIFLEYHYGNSVEDNDLLELLELLEKANISYQITKSPGFAANTTYRAMGFVGQKYSLNIWGKRL